jgi:hypothetical protein
LHKRLFFVAESLPDFWSAFRALREETIMALSARIAPSKTKRPVTLKRLAATLAEEHQLTKKAPTIS